MAKTDNRQVVTVEGRRIKLTSLDKVLYPETGTTKGDVIYYYSQIGRWLIPHAANRAATQKRWVNGVGTAEEPGDVFFQKNLDKKATPDWVPRQSMTHKTSTNCYPLVNDQPTLTWLAQMAALELHVPQWKFDDDGGGRGMPDRLVLDLDPGEGTGLAECAEVARLARSILEDMGLHPIPVTSGSKGIHLYAGLKKGQSSEDVSTVAHELARALEADHPDLIVSDMKKSLRRGKVLVDWSQNNAAKTTITPYSLRGRMRPMVAAPRTWEELDSEDLQNLDYQQVLERMDGGEDPLAELSAGKLAAAVEEANEGGGRAGGGKGGGKSAAKQAPRRPNVPAGEKPEKDKSEAAHTFDRLQKYRSMRDPEKTPEPVPEEITRAEAGHTFVIQEHHASRLHYDFRLEHDGVLVSWAVPKGVPTSTKKNHLAVQTEDHPMEYGSFEGTIPKDEYGGGDVSIWDAGTYELEKWRDGKEVIVTLYGQDDGGLGGPRKYALIHTGGADRDENNWLIHLMKDQPSLNGKRPARKVQDDGGKAPPRKGKAAEADVGGNDPGKRPPKIVPMMAKQGTIEDVDGDDGWGFEMKWDGIRATATVYDGELTLTSRNDIDLTVSYPELEELTELLGNNTAVLDGEIVAINKAGRPDFGLLQTRMQLTKKSDVEREAKKTRAEFMVFDLLYFNGTSLLKESYRDRRRALDLIFEDTKTDHIHLPPGIDAPAKEALESSRELGLEGIMAKKCSSTYSSAKRTGSWIKIKNQLTQEVVIGGWRPGKGNRANQIGSLLMGIPDGGGLEYVGRVGTGFSEKELDALTAKLKKLERKTSPFDDVPKPDVSDAHWVTPKLVGEVRYAERTGGGRLRQPAWRGWRPDKEADEVRTES